MIKQQATQEVGASVVWFPSAASCFLLAFLCCCLLLTHFLHCSLSSSMGCSLSGVSLPWCGSSKTCDLLGHPSLGCLGAAVPWEWCWTSVGHLLPTVHLQPRLLCFVSLPAATLLSKSEQQCHVLSQLAEVLVRKRLFSWVLDLAGSGHDWPYRVYVARCW